MSAPGTPLLRLRRLAAPCWGPDNAATPYRPVTRDARRSQCPQGRQCARHDACTKARYLGGADVRMSA